MSGFPSSLQQAIQGSRRGGNVVLFGLSSGDVTIPQFEDLITAGKRIHAIVGRRCFSTWEITKQLLEDQNNGIQDLVWKHVLEEGKGPESLKPAVRSVPPVLLAHGDQDDVNPIAASQKMADAARAAGVDTTYATVLGGTHLEAYLTYASRIFDFLDAHRKN